jgi:hypothetical protein
LVPLLLIISTGFIVTRWLWKLKRTSCCSTGSLGCYSSEQAFQQIVAGVMPIKPVLYILLYLCCSIAVITKYLIMLLGKDNKYLNNITKAQKR